VSYRLTLDVRKLVHDLHESPSVEIPGLLFERVIGTDDMLETVVFDNGKLLATTQLRLRETSEP
jgi:hypothetical protein